MLAFCMSECKWWFLSLVIPLSLSSYFVLTHALWYANASTSCWGMCDKEALLYEGCLAFSGLLTNQNVVLLTNLK